MRHALLGSGTPRGARAMAARGGARERPDAVQLDRLLGERVRKELRGLRLLTEYGLNPLRRGEAAGPSAWNICRDRYLAVMLNAR